MEEEDSVDYAWLAYLHVTASVNWPTKTDQNNCCGQAYMLPCVFRAIHNKVPCMCAHRSVFETVDRRTFSPCSHCAVSGNHRLSQTAKSWFWRHLTYRRNSFLTRLIPNRASHGMFPSLLEGCLVRISSTCWLPWSHRTWRLKTTVYMRNGNSEKLVSFTRHGRNYASLTECRGVCMNCLPQPWFLSRLSLHDSTLQDYWFSSLSMLAKGAH